MVPIAVLTDLSNTILGIVSSGAIPVLTDLSNTILGISGANCRSH